MCVQADDEAILSIWGRLKHGAALIAFRLRLDCVKLTHWAGSFSLSRHGEVVIDDPNGARRRGSYTACR